MDFGDGAAWLFIPIQIFFVDLLLGADNALLIALACRSLGPEDTRKAILLGTSGAILLRLALAVLASSLLALPLVKLAGAWVLIVIALNVAAQRGFPEAEDRPVAVARSDLWSAAMVIVVADAAMSLDNVVALAAIARGNFWLLLAGVAFSIPVLAYGGLILSTLLRNAPGLVTLGAALLGWIAGGMAVSDPLIANWANVNAPGLVAFAPALGAAFVALYAWLRPRSPAPPPMPRLAPPKTVAKRAIPAAPPRAARLAAPVAPPPQPPRPSAPSFEPPEPLPPSEPVGPPATQEDRIAIIGVLILAVIAGVVLMIASYFDSFN
ncbi:MAG: YjbE family putative metal transport protein [Roseiarcus sp.]|jgi:YjbE family integral membrane protein